MAKGDSFRNDIFYPVSLWPVFKPTDLHIWLERNQNQCLYYNELGRWHTDPSPSKKIRHFVRNTNRLPFCLLHQFPSNSWILGRSISSRLHSNKLITRLDRREYFRIQFCSKENSFILSLCSQPQCTLYIYTLYIVHECYESKTIQVRISHETKTRLPAHRWHIERLSHDHRCSTKTEDDVDQISHDIVQL